MDTLLLDQSGWDLVLDVSGNIAVASNPYSIAQDVSCALRTFQGEVYYDSAEGVPALQSILGENPSASFLQHQFEQAALTVPEVVKAKARGLTMQNQVLTGIVEVIDVNGVAQNVSFF